MFIIQGNSSSIVFKYNKRICDDSLFGMGERLYEEDFVRRESTTVKLTHPNLGDRFWSAFHKIRAEMTVVLAYKKVKFMIVNWRVLIKNTKTLFL